MINSKYKFQTGISLMLSVLVLAAITAISFSLTTIVFVELKSSSDVVKSEPALYATLGVTEEALFEYKRYVNEREDGTPVNPLTFDVPSTCASGGAQDQGSDTNNICALGGVTIGLPGTQPLDFDDPVRLETILAGQTLIIPLYELNDYSLQYKSLQLQRVPTGNNSNLLVSVVGISQDPNVSDHILLDNHKLTEDDGSFDINGFLEGYQYELKLVNSSDNQDNIQLSIASFGPSGEDKGLPFIGKKVLKVVAEYLGLNRTYRVYVPVP